MNTTPDRLALYLSHAIAAAKLGGVELEQWRSKFAIREKSRADLVTDADVASQAVIKEYLLGQFPDHVFVGEEDFVGRAIADTRPGPGAPPTWVVDPLDGTCNYAHDFPAYCVSIGLWADGRPVVGVILDTRMNELFTASLGGGAFLNGQPMRVSGIAEIGQALLSTGFPADYPKQMRCLEAWKRVAFRAQSIRRTGSTALNLAYVACGRFDGYWAFDNWPWDVLAGAVLITEAGGTVQTSDGHPFDPFRPDISASNGRFHAALVEAMNTEPK
jgi:myo-inositol-1(or 4)-monophosphatase